MLKQQQNETKLQYIKRIVEGKLTDKTIDDDFVELSEILFGDGNRFNSSEVRKRMYGMKRLIEFIEEENIDNLDSDSILTAMDIKKFELEEERRKLFDQRRELKKINTTNARNDYLVEYLIYAAEKLNNEKPLNFDKFYNNYSETEAVLVFSDWHYGMVTDNIWNKYNTDICKERVELLVSKVKKYIGVHKPKRLNIILLGDSAHGSIHASCRVESEEDACDQLMQVSEIIAESIAELNKFVEETFIYSTYGNHMRTIQDKKESKHSDNMEKIVPWWIKQRLQEYDNVHIVDADYYEFIKLNVLGYNIVCAHGDLDKIKNFGLTVNTLFNKLYRENIDYTILGDKHHIEEFEQLDIENILVRSLCGTDSYANNLRLYSKAGQTLIFFTKEEGRLCTYNIKLS